MNSLLTTYAKADLLPPQALFILLLPREFDGFYLD